ncbi:hypothetical protein [Microbulbifer hydrolyticus]|uniref:Uncharacterized protein n=1 Tax=Microbulbifer hydrolyticus TaxID=48074 RepID=A0A6P1TAC3_9GAMM|nr:hypothetical protein [Microbulbifer hydrolyticus]MBB5210576.1 hypothetical protein [Microbulbifer hydrolyticus]QHQ38957.1 hypothetical protein GTQ55_08150 [Microbulbifer hydrolyticus]
MASWLPIVAIIFAVVLVVGPVMWLKPSSRERKLADLRQRAAMSGLKVQMQSLPASQGTGNAAVYFSQWRNPRRLQTGWGLELQRMSHEMNFDDVWDWRNGREAPESAKLPLKELLSMLPADATAVYANDSGLGVQWRERSGDNGLAAVQEALGSMRPVIEEAIRQATRQEEGTGNREPRG